ncbi:MAG: kelch repeat-containing protein [Patescibacteria group bacterium]|nr:kelch repeat-containing protein [Patescibacteria group bacterium]
MNKIFQNKTLSKSIQIFLVCLVVLLLPKSLVQANTWIEKDSMTASRIHFDATVVDGKIYAIGGVTNTGPGIPELEEYDPGKDSWTNGTLLGTKQYGRAVVALDNEVYAMGGYAYTCHASTKVVEKYDPATGIWTAKPSMNDERTLFAAVALDNEIYAIGGSTDTITLSTMEKYNPDTGNWTYETPMQTARQGHAAVVVNNGIYDEIYVIGGSDCDDLTLSTMEKYDPATGIWTYETPMPTARWRHDAVTVNGKIYVIGGNSAGGSYLSTVEKYDPATGIWTAEPSMNNTHSGLAAVKINNKIYAMGGFGSSLGKKMEEFSVPIPPPTCDSFIANSTPINLGGSSNLAWKTTNAISVSIDNGVASTALDGNENVSPASTTTYTLTATNVSGETDSCSVTVEINPPTCDIFTANPSPINIGDPSKLAWETTNATSAEITNDIDSSSISAAIPDSDMDVYPAETTIYTLTVTNDDGDSATCLATVNVSSSSSPPTPPSGGSGHMELHYFDKDVVKVLNDASLFLLGIVGKLVLLFLIYGGVRYITSSADPQKHESARKIIAYSILGLIFILVSYAMIFAISKICY